VNFNLAQNYFEFQKKGSTLTPFLGKMKIKFVFSTSFRQRLQHVLYGRIGNSLEQEAKAFHSF